MKKYIVKYKDGEKTFGEYNSRKEASDELMNYIHDFNNNFDGEYISPFDFVIEEVKCNGVSKEIACFESAKRYLNLKGPNKKNIEPLIAIDQLFTIAEAWNKADGFVPDFSDFSQDKFFPWFKYDKKAARFVFAGTDSALSYAYAYFGCRLCFKTSERAEQFGKQFIELYKKVLL